MKSNDILKLDEVAKHFRVSRNTIYRLVKQNKIPALRITRRDWRFDREQIDRWVAKGGTLGWD